MAMIQRVEIDAVRGEAFGTTNAVDVSLGPFLPGDRGYGAVFNDNC